MTEEDRCFTSTTTAKAMFHGYPVKTACTSLISSLTTDKTSKACASPNLSALSVKARKQGYGREHLAANTIQQPRIFCSA
ncbi:hypothetical protein C8T65DRAFT_629776 [Cerioporus squamosus]|nr:hypothetical protein C8T65DRAFT_629776 [Cerioporus squamosus]